jgi:arylsulfate sulfotransferase
MRASSILVMIGLACSGCGSGEAEFEERLSQPVRIEVNPSGRVPLGALIEFSTLEPSTVELTVHGLRAVSRTFSLPTKRHELPVLGLYPGTENVVETTITEPDGSSYSRFDTIATGELPTTFPTIRIQTLREDDMEPGYHLFDLLLANDGKFLPYTVLFDNDGTVRWYMDMSEQGQIAYTPYRLSNGNWLYLNWIELLEVDDLGRTISEQEMYNIAGNHEIIELPGGQLLMGGSKKDSYVIREGKPIATRFDHVVQWDRINNRPAGDWDLRQVLPVNRSVFPADYGMDPATDWFHVNSILPVPPRGQEILVSGRNQGVVKIDLGNELQYLIAPHSGWPAEMVPYLLTAVDESGDPFPPAVQDGRTGTESFDWPMGQHALNILPNGNVLLFDNGLRRHFDPTPSYSRAVEYRIDEEGMTIEQVWQYGKERGTDLYSPITSDVDYLPQTGNRLITSGNIRAGAGVARATIVEVTYPNNQVVFEADIEFKDQLGSGEKSWGQFDLVFRGERYPLIPH